MKKIIFIFIILLGVVLVGIYSSHLQKKKYEISVKNTINKNITVIVTPSPLDNLKISEMRKKKYPGSDMVIESTLNPGNNYNQYIASYKSDGLKIYGLLTIPTSQKPVGGYPVILFNHGYIPPSQYRTTERYVAYVDAFARNGYIVFKPDYRGNGNSEGTPETSYYSPAYTIDNLNALSSLKKLKDANPEKIGIWGHSMGGNITLRTLVVDPKDIKAAVIWGGVVGSYNDLIYNWHRVPSSVPLSSEIHSHISRLRQILSLVGDPNQNPKLWNSIDPTKYLTDIITPIQLHHGLADEEVPPAFSEELKKQLEENKKLVELYEYPGADHNISSPSFELAMQRSIEFFDKYLK